MKKYVSIIITCILVMLSLNVFAQEREISVYINSQLLSSPVPARIVNGRTMLPMRVIFERLGAVVSWSEADRIIFATKDDTLIVMQIDNKNIAIHKTAEMGSTHIELDVAPFIDSGHTLVPVRAIAEALGANVEWDSETYTVRLSLSGTAN